MGHVGAQPRFLSVRYGMVVYAVPAMNMCAVAPLHNLVSEYGEVDLPATVMVGTSTRRSGTGIYQPIQPGTMVTFAELEVNPGDGTALEDPLRFVIGALPNDIADGDSYRPPKYLFSGIDINFHKNELVKAAIESQDNMPLMENRSGSIHMETLSGDYDVSGPLGNFMFMGAQHAGIGGSQLSRMEFHGGRHQVTLTALDMLDLSPTVEAGRYLDRDGSIVFSRRAISLKEGMGLYASGEALKKDSLQRWTVSSPGQQGIFRHCAIEGIIVDGEWETMAIPENKSSGVRTVMDYAKPHVGMLSMRKGYDGAFEVRSATEISLVRSLYVPVPRELLRDSKQSPMDSEADVEWWKDAQDVADEDLSLYCHQYPTSFAWDMDRARQRRMRARPDNWKLYTREELAEELSIEIADQQTTLELLEETAPEYEAPPMVAIKDQTTGQEHKVAALESFIRQLADGTVVISDGYGCEIRMRRGSMDISCPGDMRIRPGRDLIEMTPRTRVMNAGGNLQIQSAKESVSFKAEKNLTMLSGNGEAGGVLLLENRAETAPDADSWIDGLREDKPINNGIIIKARKGLAMLSTDMYVGVRDDDDRSKSGVARTKPGTILLDACGGVLGLLGKSVLVQGETGVTVEAISGSTGAALGMTAGGITAMGAVFSAGVGAFNIGPPSPFNAKVLDTSGMQSRRIVLSGSDVNLAVGGSVLASGNGYFGGTVAGATMGARSGRFGNATADSGLAGIVVPPRIGNPTISSGSIEAANKAFGSGADPKNNNLFTGAVLNGVKFSYLSSAGYHVDSSTLVWAAMRWQSMLDSSSPAWEERPVENADNEPSYVYPGKEGWDSIQLAFSPGEDGKSLSTGYIINTRQP